MKLLRVALYAMLLAVLTSALFAQSTLDAQVTMGKGGGAYAAPEVRVGLEAAHKWEHLGIGGSVYVIPTGKSDTGDGVSGSTRAEVFVPLQGWKVGIGESFAYVHTSAYDKQATHPYALLGYDASSWRVNGRYFLPYGDQRNGLHGLEVLGDARIYKRLWLRVAPTIYNSYPTDCASCSRTWRGDAMVGVLWRFRS